MVSLVPLLPAAAAPTPLPRPSKALLRRATLSGIIRTSDDADLNDDSLSAPPSPSKRAKVTFNPNVEEKVMEEYTVRGRTLDSIRAEVRRSIEAHQRGDSDGYDVLKEVFLPRKDREAEAEPDLLRVEIKTYLLALTNCVSLLKGCSGLVKAILACDWMGRDASFVKAYIYFLGNLVSAQGVYMGSVLAMLVGHFHGVSFLRGRLPGYPVVSRSQLSSRVHAALRHLLSIVPSANDTLSRLLSSKFPFADDSRKIHMIYVNNLVQLLNYAPQLRSDVFALITDRLVKIDVQMQVDLDDMDDELAAAIVQAISLNPSCREHEGDGEEPDDSDTVSITSDVSLDSDAKHIKEVQDNVEKMDAILELLFTTYNQYFSDPNSREATEMFDTLLVHFQKIILPTYRSRHTQFIIFHFSQTAEHLIDQFAGTCVQLAFDPSRPAVLRQSSASYLASFVARGAHVPSHVVRTVFELIGDKLDGIRAENELTCHGPDLRRYSTFYALTQALLYIFCFRWRDLLLSSDSAFEDGDLTAFRDQDLYWTPGVKETLFRTLHSKLNPLKICAPSIVTEFARIAKHLEFMQIYPRLEANKRVRLSQYSSERAPGAIRDAGNDDHDESWHQLDAYFPFDPYQLPMSKKWVENDYVQWKDVPGTNQDANDSEDEDDVESTDAEKCPDLD